jgi:hypothetical protein
MPVALLKPTEQSRRGMGESLSFSLFIRVANAIE